MTEEKDNEPTLIFMTGWGNTAGNIKGRADNRNRVNHTGKETWGTAGRQDKTYNKTGTSNHDTLVFNWNST